MSRWQEGPRAPRGLQSALAAAGAGAVPCVPHSMVTGPVPLPPAGADAELYEGSNSMLHACRFLGYGVGGVWLPLSEVQGSPQASLWALRLQLPSVTQEDSAAF